MRLAGRQREATSKGLFNQLFIEEGDTGTSRDEYCKLFIKLSRAEALPQAGIAHHASSSVYSVTDARQTRCSCALAVLETALFAMLSDVRVRFAASADARASAPRSPMSL